MGKSPHPLSLNGPRRPALYVRKNPLTVAYQTATPMWESGRASLTRPAIADAELGEIAAHETEPIRAHERDHEGAAHFDPSRQTEFHDRACAHGLRILTLGHVQHVSDQTRGVLPMIAEAQRVAGATAPDQRRLDDHVQRLFEHALSFGHTRHVRQTPA